MTDTEKAALERRIDELCQENERLREQGARLFDKTLELGTENAKLRELVARMAEALGIDCEWADPNWCKSPCVLEFECWPESDHTELRCPAWAIMHELGIEATA